MIPVSDPKALNMALVAAVREGNMACVQALLSHADPKMDHSDALQMAVFKDRQDFVEFLLPHSDAQAALDALADMHTTTNALLFLRQYVEAQQQKAALEHGLENNQQTHEWSTHGGSRKRI